MAESIDSRIIKSIREMYAEGEPIFAYNVGMRAGFDPSTISRWFRDHGIFWDSWRREWVICVPEIAEPALVGLQAGVFGRAEWLRPRWLKSYTASVAKGGQR